MSISKADVAHIAALARLDLMPAEMDAMARDLGRIIEYVERIAALDSAGPGAGDATPAVSSTPFREDIVLPSLGTAEALRPSADHDDYFFRVPAVIERGLDDLSAFKNKPDEP